MGIGMATYAPLRALALDDVEVYPVQLWPERPLLPEVRVNQHGESYTDYSSVTFDAVGHGDLPTESMPETSPTLITSVRDVYLTMAWRARGPSRRSSSERKTTVAKVRRAIAQCMFDLDGRVEFGARSMRRRRAIFAASKAEE